MGFAALFMMSWWKSKAQKKQFLMYDNQQNLHIYPQGISTEPSQPKVELLGPPSNLKEGEEPRRGGDSSQNSEQLPSLQTRFVCQSWGFWTSGLGQVFMAEPREGEVAEEVIKLLSQRLTRTLSSTDTARALLSLTR